ncbi:MAG: hypothetical protein ACXWZ3_11100 [Solirubrobacterales bacterium]
MRGLGMRLRALALTTAVALTAGLVLASCGDDDDGGDDSSASKITITVSGSKQDQTFSVDPTDLEAGVAEIEIINDSQAEIDGQLVFTAEERSDEEVAAQVQNAIQGRPVEDWFQGAGGPGFTLPGQTSTATQALEAGTYYVVGGEDAPEPPLVKFTVADGEDGELPETDAEVTAVDYSFTGEGLKAGSNEVLLKNDGQQWHHFLAGKLKAGATIEEAQEFLASQGQGGGPNPFEGEPGEALGSTVMDGGVSQIVTVDLEPGNYAFFCFISDRQGGPPHVTKGMVSEVAVE